MRAFKDFSIKDLPTDLYNRRFLQEKYLVLLMDAEPQYSIEIAKKIRMTAEQNKISMTEGFVQKTISNGMSEFPQILMACGRR